MVDKESHFMLICSIKKEVQEWHLYDCYGDDLGALQNDKRFSSAMNKRYRGKRNVNAGNESCVWILIGKNETEEVCLQVGRTKNLTNLLSSDVKEDIKEICKGDNNGEQQQIAIFAVAFLFPNEISKSGSTFLIMKQIKLSCN